MSNSLYLDFWLWFKDNHQKYRNLEVPQKDDLLEELSTVLQNIHDELYFEISAPDEEDICEFILTVEGNEELFELVEEMIKVAPKIEKWNFIPLKPAEGFDFTFESEGISITPNKTWFIPMTSSTNPNGIGLSVAIEDYNPQKEEEYINGIYIITDLGLGERKAAEHIRHIEVHKAKSPQNNKEYFPLHDLANVLEWHLQQNKS